MHPRFGSLLRRLVAPADAPTDLPPQQNLPDLARQLHQLRLDRDAGVLDEAQHASQRLLLLERRKQQNAFGGDERRAQEKQL